MFCPAHQARRLVTRLDRSTSRCGLSPRSRSQPKILRNGRGLSSGVRAVAVGSVRANRGMSSVVSTTRSRTTCTTLSGDSRVVRRTRATGLTSLVSLQPFLSHVSPACKSVQQQLTNKIQTSRFIISPRFLKVTNQIKLQPQSARLLAPGLSRIPQVFI